MRIACAFFVSFALLSGGVTGIPEHSQKLLTEHDQLTKSLDKIVAEALDEFHTPGLAVAVVDGEDEWAKGYGYSSLPQKEPVTPHTLFCTASTTKSFTAAIASLLVDSNLTDITWSGPLADLIREDFVLTDEYATNHVTLVDALSHRTGMPRHDLSYLNGAMSERDIVRGMRYLPLHNEIRAEFEYCNIMFSAVAHAIQTVTGEWMGDLLRKWIWEPLGMTETFYSLDDASACRSGNVDCVMARAHRWDNSTKDYTEVSWEDIPFTNGASGVISNVLDYTKWVRTLINQAAPLSKAGHQAMQRPYSIMDAKAEPFTGPVYYGLGLIESVYRGERVITHGGATAGYMSNMMFLPDRDWGVVTMQNVYSVAQQVVFFHLLDEFLETPVSERYNMVQAARDAEAKAWQSLEERPQILYPNVSDKPLQPALSLQEYEGVYHHPAYHNFTVSLSPKGDETHAMKKKIPKGYAADPSMFSITSAGSDLFTKLGWVGTKEKKTTADDDDSHPAPLLYVLPSPNSLLNISMTLHHVSGEHWYARMQEGTSSWITDQVLKAQFKIGPDGRAGRFGLQAESAMDVLSWFERV